MSLNIPDSQQTLRTYEEIQDALRRGDIAEDYFELKRDHESLLNAFTSLLSMVSEGDFSPLNGTGSPEGVVAANYSLLYVDTAGPALYYNGTYGSDTGWVLL